MAIKKKKESGSYTELPANIDALALKAFSEQFLKTRYEDEFKATKEDLFKAIETSDMEITVGEGLKCKYGSIIISDTTRKKVDNDKLIELIHAGKVTLEQVLACVSTYNNEELEKSISSKVFEKISTSNVTRSTTLKANAEFKAKCDAQFTSKVTAPIDVHEELERTEIKVKEEKVKLSSREKLKQAMAKKDEPMDFESVDDELDAILKS